MSRIYISWILREDIKLIHPLRRVLTTQDTTQVGDGARDGARSKTPPTTPSKAAAKGKLLGVKVLFTFCIFHCTFLIFKVLIFLAYLILGNIFSETFLLF